MVKRQRKGFVARLLSLVVVVLILAAAAILRDGRILGHDLREAHEAKALKNDTLEVTPDGAFVVNTKPLAKDVQGFGGPVPLKIHIKDGRVAAVEAEPNAESPDFFNRAKELLNHWQGKSVDEALAEEVDAVSGATFSSRAIIANMQRGLAYAKQHGQWGEDGSVGALGTSAPPGMGCDVGNAALYSFVEDFQGFSDTQRCLENRLAYARIKLAQQRHYVKTYLVAFHIVMQIG